jgi:phospholipase/lecithinase/hemolysin
MTRLLNRLIYASLLVATLSSLHSFIRSSGVSITSGEVASAADGDGQCSADPVSGFGVIGDSNTDEYRADDSRGGIYADVTFNWLELLVRQRGLKAGPWGIWGEPRRTGFAYNWSRTGATTDALLQPSAPAGLLDQIAAGEVSHVFVHIGTNDFAPWNSQFRDIYDGRLDGSRLEARLDGIVTRLARSLDALHQAGPVRVVLASIPNIGLVPEISTEYPDQARRRRVTDAINRVNQGLAQAAALRGVPIADLDSYGTQLFERARNPGGLTVGGLRLVSDKRGDAPQYFRLADNVGHTGTLASGLFANQVVLPAFRTYYGMCVEPMSDEELLSVVGLAPIGARVVK